MRSKRLWVLFALLYFFIWLLVTAPASLLNVVAVKLSERKISLANCHGTIWQGGATPVLNFRENSPLVLHALSWEIKPSALLRGQIEALVTWDDLLATLPMQLLIDRQEVTLHQVRIPLPATSIGALSSFLQPAQFTGNMLFESPLLSLKGQEIQGAATVYWHQAGSALSTIDPLGNYKLNIVANKSNLLATLSTENGALLLEGQGSWSAVDGFKFDGVAQAREGEKEMLSELLHHLGPEISPSIYRISF